MLLYPGQHIDASDLAEAVSQISTQDLCGCTLLENRKHITGCNVARRPDQNDLCHVSSIFLCFFVISFLSPLIKAHGGNIVCFALPRVNLPPSFAIPSLLISIFLL